MAPYYILISIVAAVSYFIIKKYLPNKVAIGISLLGFLLTAVFPLIITRVSPLIIMVIYTIIGILATIGVKRMEITPEQNVPATLEELEAALSETAATTEDDLEAQEQFVIPEELEQESNSLENEEINNEEDIEEFFVFTKPEIKEEPEVEVPMFVESAQQQLEPQLSEISDPEPAIEEIMADESEIGSEEEYDIPESYSYAGITRSIIVEPEPEVEVEAPVLDLQAPQSEEETVNDDLTTDLTTIDSEIDNEIDNEVEAEAETITGIEDEVEAEAETLTAIEDEVEAEAETITAIEDEVEDEIETETESVAVTETETNVVEESQVDAPKEPVTTPEEVLTAKQLITNGLSQSRAGNYKDAVKMLMEALKQQPEPMLKYLAVSEISTIYQHIGFYQLAASILAAYIKQRDMQDHPGLKSWQEKLVYFNIMVELLKEHKQPSLPYNEVPDFIKKKAFSKTLEKINK